MSLPLMYVIGEPSFHGTSVCVFCCTIHSHKEAVHDRNVTFWFCALRSYMCAQSLSDIWLFGTPWTIVCQAPLSWDSPGKNTGVGCYFFLQGIFPTQGLNLRLLATALAGGTLYHWATLEALWAPGQLTNHSTAIFFSNCKIEMLLHKSTLHS